MLSYALPATSEAQDVVVWEIHEPGPPKRFQFSRSDYVQTINNARLGAISLLWANTHASSVELDDPPGILRHLPHRPLEVPN